MASDDPVLRQELTYKERSDLRVRDLILEFQCQPILFIGSGLPRRYFSAPNWLELLKTVFEMIPGHSDRFEYYRQKLASDPKKIGTALADLVFEWAWSSGREKFPDRLFGAGISKDAFLKYMVCHHLEGILPEVSDISGSLRKEIDALAAIRPHAIITTNYDMFLERVFQGYEPITGQTIIKYNTNSFGEIFHIHGDVTRPDSIVLTENDYQEWSDKKKYVSAKLLTYFAEHPVFVLGYSLGDSNVRSILRDIGEIVADETGLIPNVYQIIWTSDDLGKNPPEQAIFSSDGKEFRINAIYTNDFQWVFEALKSQSALTSVNPKLVRALAARTMKLVRHDIPSGNVVVDYDVLERVVDNYDELPKLLGISTVDNPNQSHPLTMTQVADRLGFAHWSAANKLVNRIKEEKGIDLRSKDNRYHCQIKTGPGKNSKARKWSHGSVDLLRKVRDGDPYEVEL